MRLYCAQMARGLADHLALHEDGADFDLARVDIRAKQTETAGADAGPARRAAGPDDGRISLAAPATR